MTQRPDLLRFEGEWRAYEDKVYEAFLESFIRTDVHFRQRRVTAQFRPEAHGKHFSFWHLISEAPNRDNKNEDDRVPDLRRCERIRWVAWAIREADSGTAGFSWWENQRGRNTHVVIWAEEVDFAVILAKRRDYYLLRTAYEVVKPHRRSAFKRERDAFRRP